MDMCVCICVCGCVERVFSVRFGRLYFLEFLTVMLVCTVEFLKLTIVVFFSSFLFTGTKQLSLCITFSRIILSVYHCLSFAAFNGTAVTLNFKVDCFFVSSDWYVFCLQIDFRRDDYDVDGFGL